MGISLLVWLDNKTSPQHILALGIGLILILLPMSALTSNDTERYLWDGAVFLGGLDPYITAPNDPAVSELRRIWPTPEEHTAYQTLYPPGALSLFAISALAGPTYGFWIWKTLASLVAIFTLLIAYDLLKRRQALKHFALIGLSPLLLFETGAAGHIDIFNVLGITAALWCLEMDKIKTAGVIIGIAATIKFLPAVIAGPLLFYLAPRKVMKLFFSASLTWGFIYLTMFGFGYKPLGLIPTFFEKWRGGAPLYPVLEALKQSLNISNKLFLWLIGIIAIASFGLSAIMAKKRYIFSAIILALATPLLLSPVLFPWYVMVFIPLLALRPNATLLIALCLAPLSYSVLDDWFAKGVWQPQSWPSTVLLIGILIGLAIEFMHNKKPKENLGQI